MANRIFAGPSKKTSLGASGTGFGLMAAATGRTGWAHNTLGASGRLSSATASLLRMSWELVCADFSTWAIAGRTRSKPTKKKRYMSASSPASAWLQHRFRQAAGINFGIVRWGPAEPERSEEHTS